MKNSLRRAVGLIAIVIGLLFFYYVGKSPGTSGSNGSNYSLVRITFTATWLVTSLFVKLTMVMDKKIEWLNRVSLALFIVMLMLPSMLPRDATLYRHIEFNTPMIVVGAMFYFGWPLADAIDLTLKE